MICFNSVEPPINSLECHAFNFVESSISASKIQRKSETEANTPYFIACDKKTTFFASFHKTLSNKPLSCFQHKLLNTFFSKKGKMSFPKEFVYIEKPIFARF
jgi:hypothetical protein